jgi:hypothetical protein
VRHEFLDLGPDGTQDRQATVGDRAEDAAARYFVYLLVIILQAHSQVYVADPGRVGRVTLPVVVDVERADADNPVNPGEDVLAEIPDGILVG